MANDEYRECVERCKEECLEKECNRMGVSGEFGALVDMSCVFICEDWCKDRCAKKPD